MLSKLQVQERLKTGEILIGYSFNILDTAMTRVEPPEVVKPGNRESFATKLFDRSFFGDRLAIRLGPVVLSHLHRKLRGRVNFKNRPYAFDLRETGGTILVMPGEGLTVSSVENIALRKNTAAIILPRLSLATAGVVAATTYIDPCWDGILQIYVHNSTRHVYELKFGESIAICRFYEVAASETEEELKSIFAKKSHHYALNWQIILDSDHDPQPLRKSPVKDAWYRQLRRFVTVFVREHWGYVVGASILSMIVAFLIGLGAFYEKMSRIHDLEITSEKNKALAESLQEDLRRLQAKQVSMGETEIIIPVGSASQGAEISLERAYSPLLVPQAELNQAERSIGVRASISADHQKVENAILRIIVTRPSADTNALPVRVRWIVGSQ